MEAIIRSARMADGDSRLLGQRPEEPSAPPATTASPPVLTREQIRAGLRDEVEAELRREMADELAKAFATERQKGREKGFSEGYAEGLERAAEELHQQRKTLVADAQALASTLERTTQKALTELQDAIAALSFEAICRMLGSAAASPDGIKGIVGQILAEVHAHGALTVRLHPQDLHSLHREDTTDAFHLPGRMIQFVADESLTHGGCIVDTPAGRFDGALDVQLKRLHQALTATRAQQERNGDA